MNKVLNIVFPNTLATNRSAKQEQLRVVQPQPFSVGASDADLQEASPGGLDEFAGRQLSGLVQRVFYPGWPHPSRQVVVTTVDRAQSGEVCARIAQAMAQELPGTVCAVEAGTGSPDIEKWLVSQCCTQVIEKSRALHPNCTPINANLWLLTLNAFLREGYDQAKVAWLRTRLSELRREFDYTIIHTPALAVSGDAILFGRLCDGVILVLEAQRTRRATACAACDALRQADVRLLGSVLSQRTFPIPQRIYSKL